MVMISVSGKNHYVYSLVIQIKHAQLNTHVHDTKHTVIFQAKKVARILHFISFTFKKNFNHYKMFRLIMDRYFFYCITQAKKFYLP